MDTMLTMCYLISEIITKQLSKAISEAWESTRKLWHSSAYSFNASPVNLLHDILGKL